MDTATGLFTWLALMPGWQFWLLFALGVIAVGVNIFAFWHALGAGMRRNLEDKT